VALSCLGIGVTVLATLKVAQELAAVLGLQIAEQRWGAVALHLLFCSIVAFLIYGGLVYLLTRALFYLRKSRHVQPRTEELEASLDPEDVPLLTILVPSYKEEPRIVLRTLLSAAFQVYPRRRIALLIDDPPFPTSRGEQARLEETRALPERVSVLLREPRSWIADWVAARAAEPAVAAEQLTAVLRRVAQWFESLAERFDRARHEEQLFVERILLAHAEDCRRRARHIQAACRSDDVSSLPAVLRAGAGFIESLFAAEIHAFERKRLANLSHEANKAMNLNSYIGLIGKSFAIERRDGMDFLVPAGAPNANLHFPASDFLITLDADSVILRSQHAAAAAAAIADERMPAGHVGSEMHEPGLLGLAQHLVSLILGNLPPPVEKELRSRHRADRQADLKGLLAR